MNMFTWLLIGHLVGDWILQNDWMATGKKEGLLTLPGTVHFAIYAATMVAALWLSGVGDERLAFYLGTGIFFFVSHWLIDTTELVGGWMRVYRQSNLLMVRVMVDQTLHVLVLVGVSLFLSRV
jgi:hypothetical protein